MKKLKIGLLGMGRIGRLHGDNITYFVKNAEIVAAGDPMLNDAMKTWAAELGISKVYDDPMKVIQDPEVEAVFICTSTPAHAELSIAAAKAGKHIFCEKPVHTDLNEIRKILAEVEKAGVKFQVGFVRRFDHNHKAVCDTVASGKLGAPCVVKVTSRDPADQPMEYIATSGGIHIDMTIHDFDMVRYLSGSEVTEVVAYGSCANPEYAKYNDVDTTIIMLKFENGALGVIDNTRASKYGYDQRTEVQCVGGCVQVSNDLENTAMISSAEGVFSAKPTWFFLERYNDAFVAEEQAFADTVLNNTEVPVNGHDGLMPVAIAIAAKKSLDEGRPVKLSEVL